jgi:hypothetical protein
MRARTKAFQGDSSWNAAGSIASPQPQLCLHLRRIGVTGLISAATTPVKKVACMQNNSG